jgi:hypothetical protein
VEIELVMIWKELNVTKDNLRHDSRWLDWESIPAPPTNKFKPIPLRQPARWRIRLQILLFLYSVMKKRAEGSSETFVPICETT